MHSKKFPIQVCLYFLRKQYIKKYTFISFSSFTTRIPTIFETQKSSEKKNFLIQAIKFRTQKLKKSK
jgi:hypothetical protein